MPPLFFLSVRLVRLFSDLLGFFVEVAGPLPLAAVFFGSFLIHGGTLSFAFLAANVLEGISQGVESVTFYETAATSAGKLHRIAIVLSIVNLLWLRVARKSY